MAKEIFGNVPLNVVIYKLRNDIKRNTIILNRFVYMKWITFVLVILVTIIFSENINQQMGNLFIFFMFSYTWLFLDMYLTRHEVRPHGCFTAVFLLSLQTRKYPSHQNCMDLIELSLGLYTNEIIRDNLFRSRIESLVNVAHNGWWRMEMFGMIPERFH